MSNAKPKDASSYLAQPYARVLTPAEEGGFSAEILEFPGCFAEGETANEALQNLESVAAEWVDSMLEQGQKIPEPSARHSHSGRIALRLPPDLHRLAVRKATRDGVSLNQCLVAAIAMWLGADDLFEKLSQKIALKFSQSVPTLIVSSWKDSQIVGANSGYFLGVTDNMKSWRTIPFTTATAVSPKEIDPDERRIEWQKSDNMYSLSESLRKL